MLSRLALGLNLAVILTGAGFAFYRIYPAAGFALLAGGFNLLMLRDSRDTDDKPKVSFVPIAFNLFLFTAGNLGLFVGLADLLGPQQEGVDPAAQLARGNALVWFCPIFTVAGIVTAVVFFRRMLTIKRVSL